MTTDVEALIGDLVRMCTRAAEALRSKAERIKALESSQGHLRDALRAQSDKIQSMALEAMSDAERIQALEAKCALLAASLGQEEKRSAELERFVGLVLKDHRNDGYPGDVDGAAVQNWALQCGLIEEFTADAPCGEGCTCAEAICADEFPTQCYRNTALGKAAIIAAQAGSKEG